MTPTEQRLADTQAAIDKILKTGQSVRKADREVQHANLESLQRLAQTLQAQVQAERRGRNRVSYVSI